MADNTRSPEEVARLNARMAEMDKYLKDPTMKLGRGPTGKFQFYKADQQKQATSVSPKKTSTATSTATATKTSAPTAASSTPPSPKTSRQYDEDTRTALQQLGPRRGVTTESITKPSAGDAAKIAAYKADQERQARNVERGRDAGIAAASMIPMVGPGLGLGARGAVKGAQALRSAAPRLLPAPAKRLAGPETSKDIVLSQRRLPAPETPKDMVLSQRRLPAPETPPAKPKVSSRQVDKYMKQRGYEKNPNLDTEINEALARRELSPGEAARARRLGGIGLKKGGAVKPGKVKIVMREFKAGKLKSGSGQKVTNPKQAVAIAMSEAGMKKAKKFGDGGMTAAEGKAYADTEMANQEALRKAREEAKKQKAPVSKRYAKGGEVGESKAMAKKEISFMQRKGAPKSMIKHEKAEYGMKKGGATKCYAKGGSVRADGIASKGKTRCKMV